MTVADRIRNKRIELGLSQTELASRAGYSDKTAISKIENAGNDITMKQIRRIANALGTTDTYLMGWQEQVENIQKQFEPYAKQIADLGKQLSNITSYQFDLRNGIGSEIEILTEKYDSNQVIRAMKFAEAFLEASPDRQKIALEILQSHQADS